jgi:hypothetical protein
MTIIYPINGKNERLGNLFKTPKHLLLYKGVPAIVASVNYMRSLFPDAGVLILANRNYVDGLLMLGIDAEIICVPDTDSQIDTLRLSTLNLDTGSVMFVDCDIVPISINPPDRHDTVYLFENKKWMKQYSNYLLNEDGYVDECNEKGEYYPYAGAGIYYFTDVDYFNKYSVGCKSISEVYKAELPEYLVKGDTTSQVFRFGTLNDIKNDESLTDRIY